MVKNCFLFCLVGFFCFATSVETAVLADVAIDSTLIDADDASLPDPDPTTFGVGDTLSPSSVLTVDGTSVFNLSGGSLEGFSDFSGSSTLNVTSGSAGGGFVLSGNATANISGGSIAGLESNSGTSVNISGGNVDFGFSTGGSIAISGGNVNAADFNVNSGDSLEISGGTVVVGSLFVSSGGTATISGGVDLNNLFFIDVNGAGASLNLVGSDFRLLFDDFDNNIFTDTPVAGPITDSLFFDGISGTSLAGTLLDGTEFRINEANLSGGGVINLVAIPEPTSMTILLIAGLVTSLQRRRSHTNSLREARA